MEPWEQELALDGGVYSDDDGKDDRTMEETNLNQGYVLLWLNIHIIYVNGAFNPWFSYHHHPEALVKSINLYTPPIRAQLSNMGGSDDFCPTIELQIHT